MKRPRKESTAETQLNKKDGISKGCRGFFCRLYSRHPSGVEVIAFTQDSLFIAIARSNGQIDIYDTYGTYLVMSLPGIDGITIRSLILIEKVDSSPFDFTLFNYRLFSVGLSGHITEWDLRKQAVRYSVLSHGGAIFSADVDKQQQKLIVGVDDGSVRVFRLILTIQNEIEQSPTLQAPPTEDDTVGVETFSQASDNGRVESSASAPDYIEEVLEYERFLTQHTSRIVSICVYNEHWVFGGTSDSKILRWNLSTGNCDSKMSLTEHPRQLNKTVGQTVVWSLVAISEHQLLASGDSLGFIHLWDTANLTCYRSFKAHEADALSLTYYANSALLISGGRDGRLALFSNAENEEWFQVGCRYPHSAEIRSVTVSSQGVLVTGALDGSCKLIRNLAALHIQATAFNYYSSVVTQSYTQISKKYPQLILNMFPLKIDIWSFALPPNSSKKQKQNTTSSTKLLNESKVFKHQSGPDLIPVKLISITPSPQRYEDDENDFSRINFKNFSLNPHAHYRCATLSHDGSYIVTSSDNGTHLFKLDLDELELEQQRFCLRHCICSALKFFDVENNVYLAACVISTLRKNKLLHTTKNPSLVIFDIQQQKIITKIQDIPSAIQSFEFSPNFKLIAARLFTGQIYIYSIPYAKLAFQFPPFPLLTKEKLDQASNPFQRPISSMMATLFTYSLNSQYLFVFCTKAKYLMILDCFLMKLVEPTQLKFSSLFRSSHPKLLKIPTLTNRDGYPTSCTWMKMDYPNCHQLLLQTNYCVASIQFEFKSSKTPEETIEGVFDTSRIVKICRYQPKKIENNHTSPEIINKIFMLAPDYKNICAFLQQKYIPEKELPPVYQRKRYGT